MKKYYLLILTFIFIGNVQLSAQNKLDHTEFIRYTRTSHSKNFFIIDFTHLKSKFEKIYFINQLYALDDIIVGKYDVNHSTISISSFTNYPIEHIKGLIKGKKISTQDKSKAMTTTEKDKWLTNYKKFNFIL